MNFFKISLLILLISSCTPEHRIYDEHRALSPNVEWKKEDVRSFQVPIIDISKTYKVDITLRYASGYPVMSVPVMMSVSSPSGETSEYPLNLIVREENGDYIGDPGYDIWDSTHGALKSHSFSEKGTYTFTLSHTSPQDPLPLLMDIGIIIDEEVN
jgi:gliding motility-associated lipoprotein GldH